jgi:hypothetical protein
VEQATEGTPYTVVPTNLGFNVELDLGERQWRDVFGRAGLRRMYRWEVTEKKSKYTINDVEVAVRWVAGVPGIGMSASGQAGRIFSFSRENIWAPERGTPHGVVLGQCRHRGLRGHPRSCIPERLVAPALNRSPRVLQS